MSLQRTQIYLEAAQIAALDGRAKALGVTRSDLIRDLIDQGLADKNNKPSLYEVIMALGPPEPDPSMTPAAFAKRRKQMEKELGKRLARNKAQAAGKLD
ncbi:MAG: CopG family transcriptional regulator [Terricaulis sp.]